MGFLAGKGWVLAVPVFIAIMIMFLPLKRLYNRAFPSPTHRNPLQLLARIRLMTIAIFSTLRIGPHDLESQSQPSSRPEQNIDLPQRPIDIYRGRESEARPPPSYSMDVGAGEESLVNTDLPSYEAIVPPPPAYFATRTAREIDQLMAVRSLYWHEL